MRKNIGAFILSGIATALILILAATTLYFYNENRRLEVELRQYQLVSQVTEVVSRRNTCINHLRMLDGAIQQWALEKRKSDTAKPTVSDLLEFLPGEFPRCPDVGNYSIGKVADTPRCSIKGHALPP